MFSSSTQVTQVGPQPGSQDADSGLGPRMALFRGPSRDVSGAMRRNGSQEVSDGSGDSCAGVRRAGQSKPCNGERAGPELPWSLDARRGPQRWGSQVEHSQSQMELDADISGSQLTFITPSEPPDPVVGRNPMAPPSPPKRLKRYRSESECNPTGQSRPLTSQGTQGRPPTCPVNLPFDGPKVPVTIPNIFSEAFDRKTEANLKAALKKLLHHQMRTYISFVRSSVVGRGDFSTVYRITHRVTGATYALKESRKAVDMDRKLAWAKEVQAMGIVQPHPNIVTFHDGWSEMNDDGEVLYIWMELCGTSLALSENEAPETCQWKEPDLIDLLKQMASALGRCHKMGIVHLDVKPDNIYRADDGVYKLGDFGIATRLDGQLFAEEGDSRYLAQELLQGKLDHLDKSDIFSLGATLYELASGRRLMKGGKMYEDLRNGKIKLFPNLSMKFQEMMKQLLAPCPEDRPSASSILRSPLLAKLPLCLSKSSLSQGPVNGSAT